MSYEDSQTGHIAQAHSHIGLASNLSQLCPHSHFVFMGAWIAQRGVGCFFSQTVGSGWGRME